MDPELLGELSVSLTELQDELLQFERVQEQGASPRSRESMQLLLRRAHSLKGTLRLAEMSHSANLIHLVESLLVRHHHSDTSVPRSGIDFIFDALDAIAQGLETTREDVSRLRSTASQLTSMLHVSVPVEPNQRAFPFPPSPDEYERILAARRDGLRLYVVDKAIRTDSES
ncbi:MAG: Hpt domain-containing protein [Polyangiaceae bacterium]